MAKVYKGKDLVSFAKLYLNAEYVDVDDELSETSVNPVQNKAITTSGTFQFAKSEYEKSFNKVYVSNSYLKGAHNGITNSSNEDGSINCVGTCTSNYFDISNNIPCYIPKGTYTLSVNKKLTQYSLFMVVGYSDGTSEQVAIRKNNKSNTLNTTKDIVKYRFFGGEATSGSVIDDTLYIQLEKGSVVTDYHQSRGELINRQDLNEHVCFYDQIFAGEIPTTGDITTLDMSKYKFIEFIGCVQVGGGKYGFVTMTYELFKKTYKTSWDRILLANGSENIALYYVNDTTIKIVGRSTNSSFLAIRGWN